jgi:polyhydroxyalkanoate synthase subunit PhaC
VFENLLARGERLARVEANRVLLRFLNGFEWLIRDPKTVVGRTPYDVILKREKLEVRRYHLGSVPPRYPVPVLLVPPLMVKPFVFDLYPGRSLVAFLLMHGFAVYLVDFGEPDDADAYVTLNDYVLDWIPAACSAVKADANSSELSMLGYCMGGLFALLHTAANNDTSVRNIVTIGAPVDAQKMGMFAWMAKMAGGQLETLARRIGNMPGGLSSIGFRLLTPMKNITRYSDLFMNMWNREYVSGFDAMNQWTSQFIDYAQGAFIQFTRDFIQHNKLVKGQMRFGRKVADLRRVHASLLAFAGTTDQIAPVVAAQGILAAVGSTDKLFRVAPGGHMGLFAGSTAPSQVWAPAAEWLAARSTARMAFSGKRGKAGGRGDGHAPAAGRGNPKGTRARRRPRQPGLAVALP